jgi:hypothetical protein
VLSSRCRRSTIVASFLEEDGAMNLLGAALTLVAAGVLLTLGGLLGPRSWDFAVSVMPGWHVTIFPPSLRMGLLVLASGVAALGVAVFSR